MEQHQSWEQATSRRAGRNKQGKGSESIDAGPQAAIPTVDLPS